MQYRQEKVRKDKTKLCKKDEREEDKALLDSNSYLIQILTSFKALLHSNPYFIQSLTSFKAFLHVQNSSN